MKILIGCEESQAVCIEFRKLGHEAYSCDLLPCSGGHPEWHLQMDVLQAIELKKWDLGIFHPPCTYFSRAGIQFIHKQSDRMGKLLKSFELVKAIWNCKIPSICIENPSGWLCTNWRRPTQRIHPWYFGDNEMKETCLWLRGLNRLNGLVEVARNPDKFHPLPEKSRIGSDCNISKHNRSLDQSVIDRIKNLIISRTQILLDQQRDDILKEIALLEKSRPKKQAF